MHNEGVQWSLNDTLRIVCSAITQLDGNTHVKFVPSAGDYDLVDWVRARVRSVVSRRIHLHTVARAFVVDERSATMAGVGESVREGAEDVEVVARGGYRAGVCEDGTFIVRFL